MSPDDIANARFSIVERGFDCDETIEFLRGVAAAFETLQHERVALNGHDPSRAGGNGLAPRFADAAADWNGAEPAADQAGDQSTTALLTTVATACEQMLAEAERQAEQMRQNARAEADHIVQQAQAAAFPQQAERQRLENAWEESREAAERLRTQLQRAELLSKGTSAEPATAGESEDGFAPPPQRS